MYAADSGTGNILWNFASPELGNPRAIHRRASSRFCLAPHFSCVPQNGHTTANTAVPRWHRDLTNALRIAISHKSVSSATFETLRALWPP